MADGCSSNPASSIDLAELRVRARKHIDEAITSISPEEKAVYLEALQKAPYLFEDECDPLKFLRTCDYDMWSAAKRLCRYWDDRKDIFGPDRAFLPLVVTGDGALNNEDILSLQAGFPCILPATKDGMKVVYNDRRQFLPGSTAAQRWRGLFYIASKLAEDERVQTEGCYVVVLLVTPRVGGVDYEYINRAFCLAESAFPIKIKKYHLVNCPPKQSSGMKKQFMVQDLISSYASYLIKNNIDLLTKVELHFERDKGDLVRVMEEELGLAPEAVPEGIGGSWVFTEALSWCRKNALEERSMYKWLAQAAKKQARKKPQTDAGHEAAEKEKQEAKEAKKRATIVINSRRKRARKREMVDSLKQEHAVLVRENEQLKAEGNCLRGLLLEAQRVLEQGPSSRTLPLDFLVDDGDRKPAAVPDRRISDVQRPHFPGFPVHGTRLSSFASSARNGAPTALSNTGPKEPPGGPGNHNNKGRVLLTKEYQSWI